MASVIKKGKKNKWNHGKALASAERAVQQDMAGKGKKRATKRKMYSY